MNGTKRRENDEGPTSRSEPELGNGAVKVRVRVHIEHLAVDAHIERAEPSIHTDERVRNEAVDVLLVRRRDRERVEVEVLLPVEHDVGGHRDLNVEIRGRRRGQVEPGHRGRGRGR